MVSRETKFSFFFLKMSWALYSIIIVDWWAWEPEKHGEYTVKSAYRKLVSLTRPDPVGPGGSGYETWSKIWKLIVPPKVKIFWWRVLHEFLPAKEILNKRHIEPTAFCECCGAVSESISHVLMDCMVAKECSGDSSRWWLELSYLGFIIQSGRVISCGMRFAMNGIAVFSSLACTRCGHRGMNIWRHGDGELPTAKAVQWCVDTAMDLWHISKPAGQPSNTEEIDAILVPTTGRLAQMQCWWSL